MNYSVLLVDACGEECGCACLSFIFSVCVCVCVCGGGDECVCFLFLFDVYACGERGSVCARAHAYLTLICLSLPHFLKHSHTLIGQSVLSNVMAT